MTLLIEAKNVFSTQGKKHILNDVSLEIRKGDFITIIGPNGAGKSVLLKVLMGFFKADKGTVTKKAGLKIGYVPQKLIIDQIIPIKAIDFLCLRKNFSKQEFDTIAAQTEIKDILTKQLHTLSGGELQRVLLARAIIDSPDLLILDEPAQNLDISGQLKFYKLLEDIYKKRKITILMVSHDLHLVMSSTKKVVCLYHHVCCSGKPESVTKHPEFISLFGDQMADLVSIYNHQHNHTH